MNKIKFEIRLGTSELDDPVIIANLINSVYKVAEEPIWTSEHLRTSIQQIAEFLNRNELFVAYNKDQLVGAIQVKKIGDTIGWFGMLAVHSSFRKNGIANALLDFTEESMRKAGCDSMQCEILIPLGIIIPFKDILQVWYAKRGYRLISSTALINIYPEPSKDLKCPTNLDMYIKELGPTSL